MDKEMRDSRAAILAKLLGRRKYEVNGRMYSKEGIIDLINSLLDSKKLENGVGNSIGRIKSRMLEHGDEPTTYLTLIANAEKEAEKKVNEKNKKARKIWGTIFLAGSLAMTGCKKEDNSLEYVGCNDFHKIEQEAVKRGVDSNLVIIAKDYDTLAHKIDEQLYSSTNPNNILRKRYSIYLERSLAITSYKPLTNNQEALEFKINTHEHVRKLGIDTNSTILNLNEEKQDGK